LLFTTPHPALTEQGDLAPQPINEPVALIHMSVAGLKDLSMVLTDLVLRCEQQANSLVNGRPKRGQVSNH
jgi:hypothetical protein